MTGDETLPYFNQWLKRHYPSKFSQPLADHHIDFWEHVESIEPGVKPQAYFAILARKGGKSSNVEAAVTRLGARGVRKFCLYVRATQDKANESVGAIAAMIESPSLARYSDYEDFINRRLGKYGNAKGWRVDMLRCDNGFSVVALGLDASVRGIKIEEYRPDLIIFDDIDSSKDSKETLEKKIETITTSILPAGSDDSAIIGIQNLIKEESIFSMIANDTAEFLLNKKITGPIPAIVDLVYERQGDGTYKIVSGTPTWQGQDLEKCQEQMNEWGLSAFLQEAQHEIEARKGGLFSHLEFRHIAYDDMPELIDGCVWCDPAVTSTDQSDAMGIQASGLGIDEIIYKIWSFEQITTPLDCLKRAIVKAIELRFDRVGVETDQGGDLWIDEYDVAVRELANDDDYPYIKEIDEEVVIVDEAGNPDPTRFIPDFVSDKAGAGYGPKVHRWHMMLTDYETGKIVHVIGTHNALEKALYRVPKYKPYDLVDADWWTWNDLRNPSVAVYMGGKKI